MTRIRQNLEVSRLKLYEQLGRALGTRKKRVMPENQKLLPLIRQITNKRPTYGYRRITALLRKFLSSLQPRK